MAVGSADVAQDISLAMESVETENVFSVDLQFLPNAPTRLCIDFTVEDDDLIESVETFQGSLLPALMEFDSTMINDSSIYITDNDRKL